MPASPAPSLSADDSDEAPSPPLLQRLQHEHELDMQRLRSEKAERDLQAERKAVDRALRREERTSHALRAECASLAQQLQMLQAQHAALAQQAEQVPRLKRLAAQRKEQAAKSEAERARAEQRAAECAQQLASERSRFEALDRSVQLEAAQQERERGRAEARHEEEARRGAELLQQREVEAREATVRSAGAHAQTELRTAEAAMWRERAEAAEARAAATAEALARSEAAQEAAALENERTREEIAVANDERRGRLIAAVRSRRRAAQWYLLHWTKLRASAAFQRWLGVARLMARDNAAVTGREAELGRLAALGAALRSGAQANTAWQLAGRCLFHWAQRTRTHSRCAARWHALRMKAEVAAVALGADGWRAKLGRRVSGERERQKRSLWRAQHVVFNTQTMRRMVFSLWRMWADGSLLHEWARTTEARWGAVHFAEREWWRAGD